VIRRDRITLYFKKVERDAITADRDTADQRKKAAAG